MYWLYKHRQLVMYAIVAAALAVGGYLLYQHFHPHSPVTPLSQEQAETPQGVQEAAEQSQVHISTDQAVEIAEAIREAPARKPDRVVETTGAQLVDTVEAERIKSGADFAIVTDPAQAGKTPVLDNKIGPPTFPADKPVTLNQYNIQAYPKALLELTAYSDKSLDVAYLRRVKVFGATGYIGPAITLSPDSVRVGARLTIPL